MPTVYAYKSFSGKRKDGTVVQGVIPQFDGSSYAGANCGACSEAMRVVSQQKGVRPGKGTPWQPTGASIRRETGDTSGGLMPSQTTRASYGEYGVPYGVPRVGDWDNVPSLLQKGYAVDLLVSYGPIDDYKSGSPGFRGNHRVCLVGFTDASNWRRAYMADPLYDGRRANIPYGPKWIPLTVLRAAAGKLDLGGGTTVNERYGLGNAYYIPSLTRIDPNKDYEAHVPAGKFMVYTVSNGVIKGRAAKETGGFSAECTQPTNYPWPGHGTYKLVKLTSGSRAGKYINAKYAKEV